MLQNDKNAKNATKALEKPIHKQAENKKNTKIKFDT